VKLILKHIARKRAAYQRLPFFEFLCDKSRTAEERLAFFPCMASFILDFGDLNRYVLRDEASSDPHQQLINRHTFEDDHHWPWYLEDFAKLGYNTAVRPCDLYKRMYSDERKVNRLLAARLAHLIWNAPSAVRIVIVEAIEETGNVLFRLTAALAREFQQQTGVELRYCGEFHFQRETGHAMCGDHAEMASIEFDSDARQQALTAVDQVFERFEEWTGELQRYALSHGGQTGDLATHPTQLYQPRLTYRAADV
jgi:hypothetical protein